MAGRKTTRTRTKKATSTPGQLHPDAAGIDLGATVHDVAVPADRDARPVRHFGTLTGDLTELADWLTQCRITTVAMEAPGVYQSLHRSKSGLGDWFQRLKSKLGTKAAVSTAAHKLARILWAMFKHCPYNPQRLGNPERARARKERNLRRQAEQFGFALTPVGGEVS